MSTDVGDTGIRNALRVSPEKISNFEYIFQTIACVVLVLDEKGTVNFINDNGSLLFEYETGELIGQNWFSTCLEETIREDRQSYFDKTILRFSGKVQISSQMQGDDQRLNYRTTPLSHENAVVTKNGNTRIIMWRNYPLYLTNGNFEGLLCIGEDITHYRETEKVLQVALSKHKALFECFPLGISVTDEFGEIIENNRLAEKLLSTVRSDHDLKEFGTPNWKILRSDGSYLPPTEYPSYQSLSTGQSVHNVEMGIINSDCSTTWVSASAAPMDQEGYGVIVTYNDITERKRLEDLLVARERLREFADRHTLEELIQFLLDQAQKLTQSKSGYVSILDASQKSLGIQADFRSVLRELSEGASQKGRGYVGREEDIEDCVRTAEPIIQNDKMVKHQGEALLEEDSLLLRQMVVPVLKGDHVTAVIVLQNKPVYYTEHDVEAVSQLSSLAWDIIGRKQAELALEEINLKLQEALAREQLLANTDELTGLNNRRRIVEIANHEILVAKRYHQPLSILVFDLDHLKWVNDTYGHSEGDAVIKQISRIALEELRTCDAIGRVGGDEFIILLPKAHAEQARQVAERIRSKVLTCVLSQVSKSVKISISVGITEYVPNDNDETTANALICEADRAMYSAKNQGRNLVVVSGTKA